MRLVWFYCHCEETKVNNSEVKRPRTLKSCFNNSWVDCILFCHFKQLKVTCLKRYWNLPKVKVYMSITVSRPAQILLRYREIARSLSQIWGIHRWQTPFLFVGGGGGGGGGEVGNLSDSTNLSRENVGNDRRPSQKSGTRRENRNTPDFSDLSATIPDDRGCLRIPVFISRESLGRSGNSEIPDRLGFFRYMKTRL